MAVLTTQAHALPQCGSRAEVLAEIEKKYSETPVAIGVDARGALMEVLASKDGETWTLVVSSPKGETCLVAAGEGWRVLKRAPDGPGV